MISEMLKLNNGFSNKCFHFALQTTKQQLERSAQYAKPVLEFFDPEIIKNLTRRLTLDKDAVIISGIAARTAAGKTTTVEAIAKQVLKLPKEATINENNPHIRLVTGDNWYKDNSAARREAGSFHEMLKRMEAQGRSLDQPESVDLSGMNQSMWQLRNGKPTTSPLYSYLDCSIIPNAVTIPPANCVVIDSIFALNKAFNPFEKPVLDLGITINLPKDIQWQRFAGRAPERGQSLEEAAILFKKANQESDKYLSAERANMVIDGTKPLDIVAERLSEFFKVIARI